MKALQMEFMWEYAVKLVSLGTWRNSPWSENPRYLTFIWKVCVWILSKFLNIIHKALSTKVKRLSLRSAYSFI